MKKKPLVFFVLAPLTIFLGLFSLVLMRTFAASAPVVIEGNHGIAESSSSFVLNLPESVEEVFSQDHSEETETAPQEDVRGEEKSSFFLHRDITSTIFWVGEDAGDDNKNISNVPSAWDDSWSKSFGGVDDPKRREGFLPKGFIPEENTFYVALPYNDFEDGKRKKEVRSLIPWSGERVWADDESLCKNRWVRIEKNGKEAYAQWEDVGPFKENDRDYVFGAALPKSKTNKHAGIDVSPAVRDALGLKDIDTVNWQFVSEADVPDGPWKNRVTASNIRWK